MRYLKYVSIFLSLVLSSTVLAQGQKKENLEKFFNQLDRMDFSGIIMVGKDGQAVLDVSFGFADRNKETPLTPQTVFTVGSITKQFTAVAILKLEMEGKLNTEDPISTYFDNIPEGKKGITIHQLLTHSAGFPGTLGDDYKIISTIDFQKKAWQEALLFNPGGGYEYSNVGYTLAAMIVEQVMGMEYEEYMVEHLFRPSGMMQTGYLLPEWEEEMMATGYRRGNEWGTNYARYEELGEISWHLKGNGGILSTPEDMLKWHQALMGNDVLSEEAKTKMYYPHVLEEEGGDIHYGYGYTIRRPFNDQLLVKHNGGNGIFFADYLRFIDDNRVIFIACNAWDRKFAGVGLDLAEIIYTSKSGGRTRMVSENIIDSFPDNLKGEAMSGFLELLTSEPDEKEILEYINSYFEKEFIDHFGEEEHVKMIGKISDGVGTHELKKIVEDSPHSYLVFVTPKEGEDIYRFEFMFSPKSEKLDGIGVDIMD